MPDDIQTKEPRLLYLHEQIAELKRLKAFAVELEGEAKKLNDALWKARGRHRQITEELMKRVPTVTDDKGKNAILLMLTALYDQLHVEPPASQQKQVLDSETGTRKVDFEPGEFTEPESQQ